MPKIKEERLLARSYGKRFIPLLFVYFGASAAKGFLFIIFKYFWK